MTRSRSRGGTLRPGSRFFSGFLALLAALPTFGIDMVLPSLPQTAASLDAPPTAAGLPMSVYLLSLGAALLVAGPLSDRFGRKPVIAAGCGLLVAGSVGCMLSASYPQFLACRCVQGIGAAGPGMAGLAIVRDAFQGDRARAQMSFMVGVINVVPMIAPSVGAALLAWGDWRLIHAAPIAAALVLFLVLPGVAETAPAKARSKAPSAGVVRGYAHILSDPVAMGYALCNAAAAAAVFAYITGSSLVFMEGFGMSPDGYGLIFGASSLSVMAGAFLNARLAAWGVSAGRAVMLGLGLAAASALLLLAATAAGIHAPAVVVAAMVGMALAFGLVSPNAVDGATRAHPDIAGAVSAAAICLQLVGAAVGSDLVARFFDGRSASSMAGVMLASVLAAVGAYAILARPAERQTDISPSRPMPAEADETSA